jgi:hypothetical protein
LIFGAHINFATGSTSDSGQRVFLQVADNRTRLQWAAPTIANSAPAVAYGGALANPSPIMKLPEAFFLPAGVELVHDWSQITGANTTGGSITWVGVQLINPFQHKAPECVKMPNGDIIRVGSRMPWFCSLGFGTRTFSAGDLAFAMAAGSMYLQYTPSVDCDVEIHDINCNFFTAAGSTTNPQNVQVKINEAGRQGMWTPELSPITGVFGDFSQVYPALPFNKSYLLEANHRLRIAIQNNNAEGSIADGFVTLRGVRRCKI